MINTSSAIMAQRNHPTDGLDDFPTPPWATRALFEHIIPKRPLPKNYSVWEPTANRGYMSETIFEYADIWESDIHDYGCDYTVHDFLTGICPFENNIAKRINMIVMNPPFNKAEQFIQTALEYPFVAVFVRLQFLESKGRYERLFNINPPSQIWAFTERVGLVHGGLDRTVSSPTAYCWMIWKSHYYGSTEFHWIPPCRKELERDEDYA